MQEFYDENMLDPKTTGEDWFNAMKDHVKYANYKQANFIVKILNEMKYLVSETDNGEAITKFEENELITLQKGNIMVGVCLSLS